MGGANGTPLNQAQATQAFARIVREVFFGESWETIEPYAERVWVKSLTAWADLGETPVGRHRVHSRTLGAPY